MSNCSSSDFPEFIQSETFFITSLHILTSLGVSIHIFGAYCILRKSTVQMSGMKWAMLNLHLWSVFFDIGIGFLFSPFIQLPALAGVGLGALSIFGLSLAEQTYFGMSLLAAVMVSVACLFETRFFILYATTSTWKSFRRPWLAANYFLAFVFCLPSYLMIPEQKSAKIELLAYIPCLPDFMYHDRYFVVTVHRTFAVLNILAMILPVFSGIGIFVLLIYWNMRQMKKLARLSDKTLKLQRLFLRALILQVTLPVTMLIAPIMYYLYSLHFHYYNQGFNNVIMIFISMHGTCSSVATILIHKPYREALVRMVKKPKEEVLSIINVSVTVK